MPVCTLAMGPCPPRVRSALSPPRAARSCFAPSFLSLKDEPARLLTVFMPGLIFFLLLSLDTSSTHDCVKLVGQSPDATAVRAAAGASPVANTTRLAEAPEVAMAEGEEEEEEEGEEVRAERVPVTAEMTEVRRESASLSRQLPSCAREGARARTFLFVFMGHSGSSAILSELQKHSKTLIELPEPVDHFEYEFNTSLALQYTRDYFQKGINAGKLPGFKMRPLHIRNDPVAWRELAREYDTRIVWQYRDNLLKQAVGEYSYKYLNDSSVIEGLRNEEDVKNRCKKGAGCSFDIKDFDFFHDTLKSCLHSDLAISRAVNLISGDSSCVHALPYEDYLYDRETSMRSLLEFLGLPFEETAPERYKATSDNLCEVVTNWKQLCENFYGCHVWRHMFDDHRNGCYCEFTSGHVNYCDSTYEG